MKDAANVTATVTGGAALIVGFIPDGQIPAAVLDRISGNADLVAGAIECLDGEGFDLACASNGFGALLPVASGPIIRELVTLYGNARYTETIGRLVENAFNGAVATGTVGRRGGDIC